MRARVRLEKIEDQRDALIKIQELIGSGSIEPEILRAAKAITRDVPARDDEGELQAIFRAIKEGDPRVPWLADGVRYVEDPHDYDTFNGVKAQIEMCQSGACAFDCDDMTILIGALCAAIGFKVGARAWGPGRVQSGDYVHVYPVACMPKSGPWPRDYFGTALDATVSQSYLGWEPEGGHIMTAWPKRM